MEAGNFVKRRAHSKQSSPNIVWLKAIEKIAQIEKQPTRTIAVEFDQLAAKYGDAEALISDHESFTYRTLLERSCRYSRWAIAHNLHKGDTVCLMMANRAEYVAIWLGLNRAGVVVALLNTSLSGKSLHNCVRISNARHAIITEEFRTIFTDAILEEQTPIEVFVHGSGTHNYPRIDLEVEHLSTAPLDQHERREVLLSDHALYIYTSGTTGLPKAAIISHRRVLNWCLWFSGLMDVDPSDRMYNCLPLYHSVGGVVAIWAVLCGGGSVVLRERFSASCFWSEVVAYDCTLFQYIGELCRYLINSPESTGETKHRLRLCVGNGLRPEVWSKFKRRFSIPHILEFYAATESNFSLYNVEEELGAVGRIPPFIAHRVQPMIAKLDSEYEQLIRDDRGYCVPCAVNEVGEVIAKIECNSQDGAANFEGYLNNPDTEKKIVRNVLKAGDAWMRSGDLMRKDARGFYYFIDRIGETFRWKGENVATSEVAEIILSCAGIKDVLVYGVRIPGHEGRACMAALVVNELFHLSTFRSHINKQLPHYARPLFVRICASFETTGTFKYKKSTLAIEAFDPRRVLDSLHFLEPSGNSIHEVDDRVYQNIVTGVIRL